MPNIGASFNTGLEGFLAQRLAEKRQAMLDEITQGQHQLSKDKHALDIQDTMSTIKSREDAAATNKIWREGQAKADVARAAKDEAEIADMAEREANLEAIKSNPEFLKLPKLQQFILLRDASIKGEAMPPGEFWKEPEPLVPLPVYNQGTGKFEFPVGPDNKPVLAKQGERPLVRTRPPVGPQAPTPTASHIGNDADGNPITFANRFDAEGKPVYVDIHGKRYTGQVSPKPTAQPRGSQISASEYNRLATLRGKAAERSGIFGVGSRAANPEDLDAYRQGQMNVISSYNTSPDVKDTVGDVLRSEEDQNTPTEEIIKRHRGIFNEQELSDFADLLRVVRGN